MLRYLRKAAFLFSVVYIVSLPVAFLVGGILFARPLRSPLTIDSIREGMRDGWSQSFLTDAREIKVQIEPRIKLCATVFGGRSSATVVVLHESGHNRLQALAAAYELWQEGLGVVLIDRRAHGNSDGEARPLYGGETDDIKAIVSQLLANDWCGTSRIGLFGIGDAGTSCMIAAAADPRIDAVAAQNPVLDARDAIQERMSRALGLPPLLVLAQSALAVRGMTLLGGIGMSDLDAPRLLRELAAPTLVMSMGDGAAAGRRTADSLGAPDLEWVEAVDGDYDALAAFFRRAL